MIYLLLYSDGQKWYFEADDEGVVYRQMLLEEGKASRISNVKKYDFFLTDHELHLDDPELQPISTCDIPIYTMKMLEAMQ
ncbi:hypothetical protein [Paenibacillus sp. DMB5]|uniref:hypothetical protein n=1 Tax=Paenibacillus sp. DMB5 TaxID=1780103 RepID=UPI00076CCD17|nr:hypothetical protein [Paenibacillus sp. DMB5]KUP20447.1 hypothetical protein AWJ19_16910 [Paenibacillus sp. DMB5]